MIIRWIVLATTMALFAAPEVGEWDAVVKEYVEGYEAVKEPVPTAYPWVAKRLRTLFDVRDVGHIRVFSEEDGKRTASAEIYYKGGELHVVNHAGGWNLVTKGHEAYEWEAGKKEGIITKVTDRDLIDYLLYLTDPSAIMTCIYYEVLEHPGGFLPAKQVDGSYVEMRFKKPVEGFRAVFVTREPAWLCGFEVGGREDGKPQRLTYSKPESLKQVPAPVFDGMKGVDFKRSDLKLRRHMVYL